MEKSFDLFNKKWALLTAGSIDKHNSMTISWGELGTLWSKPVATVFVKPCRYTHQFMEENEYFVLSFFKEEYRQKLGVMGSYSGKNVDKDQLAGLTPLQHGDVTIYKEAEVTLICRKIYQDDLDINHIPEAAKETYYKEEKPHTMYIGEVIKIIK